MVRSVAALLIASSRVGTIISSALASIVIESLVGFCGLS